MKIRLIILLFILCITETAMSQNSDFGIWYGLNGEYALSKKLDLNFSGSLRTFENASKINEAFLEGGINYKFNKTFSASGSYRFTEQSEGNYGFYPRHKFFAGIKAALPAGNFIFSSRILYQYQQITFIKKLTNVTSDSHLRYKVKSVYKIPSFPLNPYVYFELFSPVFDNSTQFIDKERISAGMELKITRKQAVELEYIFQRDFKTKVSKENIISINYNFKF